MITFLKNGAVRRWMYGVAVAAAGVLVGYGFLTLQESGLWLTLFGALFGFQAVVAGKNVNPSEPEDSDEPPLYVPEV